MKSKNVNSIDKIIAELSMKDYKAQRNKLTDRQKYNVSIGKRQFSYDLSAETLEAIEIKHSYINDILSENDYKSYCLKYNLRTS